VVLIFGCILFGRVFYASQYIRILYSIEANKIQVNLLSKLRLIVALLSPSSFLAVTLYFPASSTATFFISSAATYLSPSFSISNYKHVTQKAKHKRIHYRGESHHMSSIVTRCLLLAETCFPSWNQETLGFGSALILHSKSNLRPSSS